MSGHTPDKLYASVDDLDRQEDWPGVTPAEECCDDLAGGAVIYLLETHERAAAPDMLAALKIVARLSGEGIVRQPPHAARVIDSAIAKAEG